MQGEGVEGGAPGAMVQFLQDNDDDDDDAERDDQPKSTPINNNDGNNSSARGDGSDNTDNDNIQNASMFYAGENIGNRWHQHRQQHSERAEAVPFSNALVHRKTAGGGVGGGTDGAIGSDGSSRDNSHGQNKSRNHHLDNNYDDANNKPIVCYCLPCLSCGYGDRGRSNVRLLAFLLVPIFLLSVFLVDDIYHVLQRNARLRSALLRSGDGLGGDYLSPVAVGDTTTTTEVLRRKVLHEFPGIHREMLWIPLERTMTIVDPNAYTNDNYNGGGEGGNAMLTVKAKLACPRGILFLFHGCGRYAASFFYSPQGRKMISSAIRAGVAVVTIKKNNERACWDWENDGETVLKLGKKFLLSRVLDACSNADGIVETYPPIWGFGVSSGGWFASMLASSMAQDPGAYAPFLFSALNVQIISPPDNVDWNIPTIFTVMDGDEITKARVRSRVESKLQSGVGGPFSMITTSGRKGIHPDHFHRLYADDRQMSAEVSLGIYQELVTLGIVDSNKNDMLTSDPRQVSERVTELNAKYGVEARKSMSENNNNQGDVLPFGVSHQIMRPLQRDEQLDADTLWLTEELNVAWDVHEITSEGFDRVLDFFFEYGVHGIGNVTLAT